MCQCKLFLFGPPRLERNGEPAGIGLRKALALLAYLAVTGQSHGRDALAALFWPADSQSKARGNLRRALSRINMALGEGQLETDRERAGLNPRTDFWLDVDHFQRCLVETQSHDHAPNEVCIDCLPLLTDAVTCYSNDFLAGFTLPDCPDFDDWHYFQSESLRQELASALERLVQGHSTQSDYEAAISFARRRLALDPLHEPAHRQLMELYALTGQQSAAIRQYNECVRVLDDELGVPPSEETTDLYETIRAKRYPVGKRLGREEGVHAVALAPSLHNLPHQPTSFIGREKELGEVAGRLADPSCRLLTLIGPGGIGKTRLAIEAAAVYAERSNLDATFVPLASVHPAGAQDVIDPLVSALANALKFAFHGDGEPKSQLLTFLQEKEILLVLDNFEHLLGTVDILTDILGHAPKVQILVTSRERLDLREEWLYPLRGMAYPAKEAETSGNFPGECQPALDARRYGAVQLFEERARQIEPNFDLAAEVPSVVRICELVDGMPLGVELAAAWVRMMPCQTIVQEIEKGVDFLAATLHDMPERHRSLRAVFEHSWQLLSREEQHNFKKLSVFQGSFSREAGEDVAAASLPQLSALVDKSLLHRTRSGRYRIHTLLRQYAAEKLQENPAHHEAARRAHARHYAGFMRQRRVDLRGSRQLEALTEIGARMGNVRASWQWAVENRDIDVIDKSQDALADFCEVRGLFQEGELALSRAVAALRGPQEIPDSVLTQRQAAVLGVLLSNQGWLATRMGLSGDKDLLKQSVAYLRQAGSGAHWELAAALSLLSMRIIFEDFAPALALLQEALDLALEVADDYLLGFVRLALGQCIRYQGEYQAAVSYFRQSVGHFEVIGERRFRAFALNSWGRAAYAMGQYDLAEEILAEALEIRQAFGDRSGMAFTLLDLGILARAQGRLAEATKQMQASLVICEETGRRTVVASCRIGLGEVARLQGDFEEAEKLLQKSLALLKEIGYASQLPICLNGLVRLAYDRGNYGQAEETLQESLAICRETDQTGELASALVLLGHVASGKGSTEHSAARQYYRRALEIVAKTGAAPVALDVLRGWAVVLMANEPTDAEQRQAVQFLAQVEHHPASEYETREKARRLLAEWVVALPPDVAEATQARGRSLDLWETVTDLEPVSAAPDCGAKL